MISRRLPLVLALLWIGAVAGPARGEPDPPLPTSGFWLHADAGLGIADATILDDLRLGASRDLPPVFGLGGRMGLGVFDLGLFMQHLGTGRYRRLSSQGRLGSMVLAGMSARWRYMRGRWGALFLEILPTWVGIRHGEAFRFDAARLEDKDLEDAAETAETFTTGLSTGAIYYPRIGLAVSLSVVIYPMDYDIMVLEDELAVERNRTAVWLAVEWRP